MRGARVLWSLALLLGLSAPAFADAPPVLLPSTQAQVDAALAAAPKGTRFGLLVVDAAGQEIVAINPDQRFIPASNTKLFTTAAAYALLPGMDKPDVGAGTRVTLIAPEAPGKNVWGDGIGPNDPVPSGPIDVMLSGHGDARLSSSTDCKTDCLATLADAVAAKTMNVRDIVGDDSFWPDQRWSPGMSWNNFGTDDGTASSALNLDDNQVKMVVTPSAKQHPPKVILNSYFELDNSAATGPAGSKTELIISRDTTDGRHLTLRGTIALDSAGWIEQLGVDDPALFAAWTFRGMLEARGVRVKGEVRALHGNAPQLGGFISACDRHAASVFGFFSPLAELNPGPLADDIVTINKDSQNLHAQVLYQRVLDVAVADPGDPSACKKAVNPEQNLFTKAGIPREGYDFSDGSGMSTYNRVSPRAVVALLRWAAAQPWGGAWSASLPIAATDGTLKRRFVGTPLAGNLAAKTGSLNATSAISGTFRAASGRKLTFAFLANDVPGEQSAVAAMDTVLLLVAASN